MNDTHTGCGCGFDSDQKLVRPCRLHKEIERLKDQREILSQQLTDKCDELKSALLRTRGN